MAINKLKTILIYDERGLPLFMHSFDSKVQLDETLFSGLLSAIGMIGKNIFNQDIATIQFGGEKMDQTSRIVVISRELILVKKQINFVFLIEGKISLKQLKSLSSMIFLEIKQFIQKEGKRDPKVSEKIAQIIKEHINSHKIEIEN